MDLEANGPSKGRPEHIEPTVDPQTSTGVTNEFPSREPGVCTEGSGADEPLELVKKSSGKNCSYLAFI